MSLFALTDYASLHVHGPDARAFLQSQLSSDLGDVNPDTAQLSAWHDPKGRVLAVMTVLPAPDGFFLVFPSELHETVAARLRLFVLRSRVLIDAGPAVAGSQAAPAAVPAGAGPDPWSVVATGEGVAVRLPGPERWLHVGPDAGPDPAARSAWEIAAVEAGLPEVFAATSGQFVAQMLNLDGLGAVSFKKGCFPGQEIIARAHYLGRVKRGLRAFRGEGELPCPGETLGGGIAGTVVRAARSGSGWQALVVVPTDAEGPFVLADGRALLPA